MEQRNPVPDQQLIAKELARQIEREIESLPPRIKEIFKLSREKHQSHKEISEQLNISDKTVKKQISNILQTRCNKASGQLSSPSEMAGRFL